EVCPADEGTVAGAGENHRPQALPMARPGAGPGAKPGKSCGELKDERSRKAIEPALVVHGDEGDRARAPLVDPHSHFRLRHLPLLWRPRVSRRVNCTTSNSCCTHGVCLP